MQEPRKSTTKKKNMPNFCENPSSVEGKAIGKSDQSEITILMFMFKT
jgi:hypothetical protein